MNYIISYSPCFSDSIIGKKPKNSKGKRGTFQKRRIFRKGRFTLFSRSNQKEFCGKCVERARVAPLGSSYSSFVIYWLEVASGSHPLPGDLSTATARTTGGIVTRLEARPATQPLKPEGNRELQSIDNGSLHGGRLLGLPVNQPGFTIIVIDSLSYSPPSRALHTSEKKCRKSHGDLHPTRKSRPSFSSLGKGADSK